MPEPLAAVRPIVISPAAGGGGRALGDVWRSRELLYFLTRRDLKVRYSQTALGIAWAVLQPLATAAVFTVFFGRVAGIPSDGAPYPLWSYAGVLAWTYFAAVVTSASQSVLGNASLITKVYFPRIVIPASAATGALVDLALGFVVLVGAMAFYGIVPSASAVLIVPLVALAIVLALGVGIALSALTVLYRDVRHVVPFALQLWMFATPIVYPLSLIPPGWRWIGVLNPMAGVVEGVRASLFGRPMPWTALTVSTAMGLATLALAYLYFEHVERRFADVV
jgi:lipopolysaccharide transport system permease protein